MTAIAKTHGEAIEAVLIQGDLKNLTPTERSEYYLKVCESLNLNPLTRPFEYLTFQGRLTLYARRDATEQLRRRDTVSVTIVGRKLENGIYTVSARARTPDGREDESDGAVAVENLKGEALANAYMKAETKAKRRVTLSICGLGMLDEMEVSGGGEVVTVRPEPTTKPTPAIAPAPHPADPLVNDLRRELARTGRASGGGWQMCLRRINTQFVGEGGYPDTAKVSDVSRDHLQWLIIDLAKLPDAPAEVDAVTGGAA